MLCPYCGATNRDGSAFCLRCRRTLEPAAPPPLNYPGAPPPPAEAWQTPYYDRAPVPPLAYTYAAFWPRFGAWLLDSLFSTFLAAIPAVTLAIVLGFAVAASQDDATTRFEREEDNVVWAVIGGFYLGYAPAYLAYHTIANAKGGGWGKRIVGLRVVKEATGQNPGFGTGFLRIFVTVLIGVIPFVSILSLLDYLWCIWDRQKQTWHDKIAGTVVVAVS